MARSFRAERPRGVAVSTAGFQPENDSSNLSGGND